MRSAVEVMEEEEGKQRVLRERRRGGEERRRGEEERRGGDEEP